MAHCGRPLVTFALLSYMHRPFIREAVEAALAQTYSPLQVIISDDASVDGSYELTEELIKAYQGTHQVVLNRNSTNLGLAQHLNFVMGLASGELVVLAGGDDVSLPERTQVLVDRWLQAGKPEAICSGFYLLRHDGTTDEDTEERYRHFRPHAFELRDSKLKRLVATGVPALVGCTEAWTRDFFNRFPPLNADVWFEDKAISFRAWLAGRIHYVPDKLVRYRQHEGNIANREPRTLKTLPDVFVHELERSILIKRKIYLLQMHAVDLDHSLSNGVISDELGSQISSSIRAQLRRLSLMADWWSSSYVSRVRRAAALVTSEPKPSVLWWALVRLLPARGFALLRLVHARNTQF